MQPMASCQAFFPLWCIVKCAGERCRRIGSCRCQWDHWSCQSKAARWGRRRRIPCVPCLDALTWLNPGPLEPEWFVNAHQHCIWRSADIDRQSNILWRHPLVLQLWLEMRSQECQPTIWHYLLCRPSTASFIERIAAYCQTGMQFLFKSEVILTSI